MRPKTSVTSAPNWAPNDVAKLESAGKSGLGENAEITAAVIYNSTIRSAGRVSERGVLDLSPSPAVPARSVYAASDNANVPPIERAASEGAHARY
ncbi:MAG: hypothetical protein ACXVIP_05600 [Halobacteriota archaeon]